MFKQMFKYTVNYLLFCLSLALSFFAVAFLGVKRHMGSWLYYWPPWTFAILFGQINIYIEGALDSRSGRHRHLVRAMLSINDNPKTFVQTRVRRSFKPIITIMYFCNSPFFEIVRLWILKVEKKIIKTLESYLPRCSIHRTIIRLFSIAFVY